MCETPHHMIDNITCTVDNINIDICVHVYLFVTTYVNIHWQLCSLTVQICALTPHIVQHVRLAIRALLARLL